MKSPLRFFLPAFMAFSLYLLADARVYYQLGPSIGDYFQRIFNPGSNMSDRTIKTRGYYEQLIHTDRFNTQLSLVYSKKPKDWFTKESILLVKTNDLRVFELKPSMEISAKNVTLRTNKWGMRDKERDLSPAPNTFRLAVLGSSSEMGSGVNDNETFSMVLESLLNQDPNASIRYEVLNFGSANYSALSQPLVLEKKALHFKPNLVLYIARPNDASWLLTKIRTAVKRGDKIPYPNLQNSLIKLQLAPHMNEQSMMKKLFPLRNDFLASMYQLIVQICKEHNARPVWVFTPNIGPFFHEQEYQELSKLALQAGFFVLDLSRVYEGQNPERLMLNEWDEHPSAFAHRLIAISLYKNLLDKKLINEIPTNDATK